MTTELCKRVRKYTPDNLLIRSVASSVSLYSRSCEDLVAAVVVIKRIKSASRLLLDTVSCGQRIPGKYLRKQPSDHLKNIITIGAYEGHAFLIKDINKLTKLYACTHCQVRFTQAYHPSPANSFTTKAYFLRHQSTGSSARARRWGSISTTRYAATGASGGLQERLLMAMSQRQKQFSNSTAATSMVAKHVSRTAEKASLTGQSVNPVTRCAQPQQSARDSCASWATA